MKINLDLAKRFANLHTSPRVTLTTKPTTTMTTAEYTTALDSIIPLMLKEAADKPKSAESINAGLAAWEQIKSHGFDVSDMPQLPSAQFGEILGSHYFMLARGIKKAAAWILR